MISVDELIDKLMSVVSARDSAYHEAHGSSAFWRTLIKDERELRKVHEEKKAEYGIAQERVSFARSELKLAILEALIGQEA